MKISGLNHLLFSVSNLDHSINFYQNVFQAKLLVKGEKTAYFDCNGMWFILLIRMVISLNFIPEHCKIGFFTINRKKHIWSFIYRISVPVLLHRPKLNN